MIIDRFQGFLGEVTVWSVALSASQIELFYRFPYTTDGTESGLVSAWKFHEESSSIIYDLNSINDLRFLVLLTHGLTLIFQNLAQKLYYTLMAWTTICIVPSQTIYLQAFLHTQ